jgi:hypothetical protein
VRTPEKSQPPKPTARAVITSVRKRHAEKRWAQQTTIVPGGDDGYSYGESTTVLGSVTAVVVENPVATENGIISAPSGSAGSRVGGAHFGLMGLALAGYVLGVTLFA